MRVSRTFAFTDLSGFTSFTHRHGDDAAREVLTSFRGAVRTVVDRHGIRVAKWLGDGAMIVSVDVDPLVEAILELHEAIHRLPISLPVRSGVTVGNVIVFEGDDYLGTTVNLAARLCERAAADEILAHAVVVARSNVVVPTQSLGRCAIRGIDVPVEVVRVLPRVIDVGGSSRNVDALPEQRLA